MVTKKIQIEFADPRIKAIDHIKDIRDAADNAGLNLYARYDVQLQYPMPERGRVVVEIRIPENIVDTFQVGRHLRGISDYLLGRCGKKYQQYLVGKRLLNYIELSGDNKEPTGLSAVDRLEAVVEFAKLLERSDDEAWDKVERIFTILREG